MDRVIVIKYGELTTKKGNRKLFINTLYSNILKKLNGTSVNIFKDMSRMYIEFSNEELPVILKKIGEVFGIHSFLIAYKTDSNRESIENTIYDVLRSNIDLSLSSTFKVETKRSDKSFPLDSPACIRKYMLND